MAKYNDEVANIYVNLAKDENTKIATRLSVDALDATAKANKRSTRENHIKAERAHNLAARAWTGIDDERANQHSVQAQIHFARAS